MKNTSSIYKLSTSAINMAITFIIALPFLLIYGISTEGKLIWIAVFFLYNLFFEIFFGRCAGMMILKTHYAVQKPIWQRIVYVVLYTISFSTLFFYIWFPFDIFLINIFAVQLPFVLITGTTFHGFFSGGVRTIHNS